MINRIVTAVFLFLSSTILHAQIDKEFWFAVPYANPSNGRIPVYLRIEAFTQAATVTIDVPANPALQPKTITIAANSSYSLDLSGWLADLENIPANTILNKGLHVTATKEISAYYELYGASFYAPGTNSDIFTFKGRNALGKLFYTPFQTRWDNQIDIDAWASFDIIATENNTLVTITPTQDIVGHAASVPFTIVLQKGQTWSGQSITTVAANRPTGTKIEATKPIAVTVKDDSMLFEEHWDMGGDQIIPVSQSGTAYFVLKHLLMTLEPDNDFAYVLATEDNTQVFLEGATTPQTTLNAGMQIEIPINQTTYITSSAPVYVLHVTGFDRELAEAIIPQIRCTGYKEVGFIRSNTEDLVLNILTKKGNENSFILNGKKTLIQASDFSVIPGNTDWVFTSKYFNAAQLPALRANLITNTKGSFHLSIMNGGTDTGFRYGYFSDFGFVDLGSDTTICPGKPYEISAGIQKDSYLWSPTGKTTSSIIARDSGTYTVLVTKDTCSFRDTIHISYYADQGDIISSKNTDTTCANQTLVINTYPSYHDFLWSTGETSAGITVNQSNTYRVNAKNHFGCTEKDSLKITVLPLPTGNITYSPPDDQTFCSTDIVHLTAPVNFSSYLWHTGETTRNIQTTKTENGIYSVVLTDSLGCKNPVYLEVDCSVFIEVYNLITPNGDGLNDFFEVSGLLKNTYSLKIYNSWGALVYSNDNYNNVWDAEPLEDGVYYFSLTHYKGKRNIKGWFHAIH